MVRIHVTQLSYQTRRDIARRIPSGLVISPYAVKRARARGVSLDAVFNTAREGTLIDYTPDPDERVLLRSPAGVCIVVSLTTARVVTVFKNDPEDNHATLRAEAYLFGVGNEKED